MCSSHEMASSTVTREPYRQLTRGRWLNFVVDALGLLTLIGLVVTGIVLRWVLPHGGGFRRGWGWLRDAHVHGAREFLGLHRHDWGEIHTILALAFIVLLVLHLILHWKWVSSTFTRLFNGDS